MSRRGFIEWAVGVGGGAMAVFYLGAAFDLLKPKKAAKATFQSIGPMSKYPVETPTFTTYTGEGIEDGLFVIRHQAGTKAPVTVFDFHCAHLQCPVQWFQGANEFACPCHGSTYNKQGEHTGGPAPHGLFYHEYAIQNGEIYVGGETGTHAGNAHA